MTKLEKEAVKLFRIVQPSSEEFTDGLEWQLIRGQWLRLARHVRARERRAYLKGWQARTQSETKSGIQM